jgi:hypothetical protein
LAVGDVSIKRARNCVRGEDSDCGGAPGTANCRDAATARPTGGATTGLLCDPVTAAFRPTGVALAQGGVCLLQRPPLGCRSYAWDPGSRRRICDARVCLTGTSKATAPGGGDCGAPAGWPVPVFPNHFPAFPIHVLYYWHSEL